MKVSIFMKPMNASYKNLSCQLITEALFRLMETEAYEDITISQITQEACVARRTFYLNFNSKEDILTGHFDTLIQEYDAGVTPEISASIELQAIHFFTFWKMHREYASLLAKNGMFHFLIRRFHLYLDHASYKTFPDFSDTEKTYIYSYFAGGLWMMLLAWLQRDFKESPRQLADIFISMVPKA